MKREIEASDAFMDAIMKDSARAKELVAESLGDVPLHLALTHTWIPNETKMSYRLVPWREAIRYYFEKGAREKVW